MERRSVPIQDKFCLTIDEAAEYFNFGTKKLRRMVSESGYSDAIIQNGVKILIKRKKFESLLNDISSI